MRIRELTIFLGLYINKKNTLIKMQNALDFEFLIREEETII